MSTKWTAGLVLWLALGAVATPVVRAADDALGRAAKLRDASADDWRAGRYAEAADKLRKALAIYDATPGETPADRAVTLRALTWNLVRAGDAQGAVATFVRLLAEVKAHDEMRPEIDTAWSAIWEAASKAAGTDAARTLLEPLLKAARKQGFPGVWAQATHSLASIARHHGENETAESLLGQAIEERRRIGDARGLVWSLNNLANLRLVEGRTKEALDPLREAWEVLHREHVPAPQAAVAANVRKALRAFGKDPKLHGAAWLRTLEDVAVRTGQGSILPPSELDRRALRLAVAQEKKDTVLALAKALATRRGDPAVPEIQADLGLRAARVALALGRRAEARRWAQAVEVGEGPCAPHLAARRALVLALVGAVPGARADGFADAARSAAAAWRRLGDFQGRRDALGDLVRAARAAGLAVAIPDLVEEQQEQRRQGAPGGAGNSAISDAHASKLADLPLDGVVFRLTTKDGRIAVEDLGTSRTRTYDVSWSPRHVALNGLSLTLFGGYAVVRLSRYGGAAIGASAPGSTTLDALGPYMPIPEHTALLVLKNGALRYAAVH
jgi:hypothetical protein